MSERNFKRVVLEFSLKPFKSLEPQDVAGTCRHLFTCWEKLIDRADEIGLMLWVGDGTDILEFNGDLSQPMTAGQYIGFCNLERPELFYSMEWYGWQKPRPYIPNPPPLHFRDLADIIAQLRATGTEMFGKKITVGATFDPGPEFAFSKFKYQDHPEVLFPNYNKRAPMHFVTCQSILKADSQRYAAFPKGIPEGTSFGTFLGGQFKALAGAVGYDYIWFSNGFAYSHFAWTETGEVFYDGKFHTEQAAVERQRTNRFWRDFRAACPDLSIEVRGTNYSVGMDLATDGVSHKDIVEIGGLTRMPCNLPVLSSDMLANDIVTFLTRMASPPGQRIVYRTYLNDPWFDQNPWYDIYNRETFEFYCALSAARLNSGGGVDTPTDLHILTIDTSRGNVSQDEANETTPHYLRALSEQADRAGPLVWVYPYDEYDSLLKDNPERLPHVFFHDYFALKAVEGGLPLNTVASAQVFTDLARKKQLPDAVFFAPVPVGQWAYEKALLDHVAGGGKAILYGSLEFASPALLQALDVKLDAEALAGDFQVDCRMPLDNYQRDVRPPLKKGAPQASIQQVALPLKHRENTCGGGLRETCDWNDPDLRLVVAQQQKKRAYAVSRARPEWNGGRLAWIRGTYSAEAKTYNEPETGGFRLRQDHAWEAQNPRDWTRRLLADFGFDIVFQRQDPGVEPERLFIKRYRNAWILTGSKPDTSVHARIRTPDGAPAFLEYETPIIDGYAEEHFGKSIYNEIRFFVKMPDGKVKAKEHPVPIGKRRKLQLSGCVDATITIYPDIEALRKGEVLVLPWHGADIKGDPQIPHTVDLKRGCLTISNYTGTVWLKW